MLKIQTKIPVNHQEKILIRFHHGMGDNVQLQIPLKHIRAQRPDWIVDVAMFDDRREILDDFCNKTHSLGLHIPPENYTKIYENQTVCRPQMLQDVWAMELPTYKIPGLPQSWPLLFVVNLGLKPDEKLFYYELKIKKQWIHERNQFLWNLPNVERYAIIHYMGITNQHFPFFTHSHISKVCEILLRNSITPIIIDYEKKSPIPNDKDIFRANIPRKPGVLTALIDGASLYIGIDSGPLHLAGCTKTPTIGLWDRTYPMYLYAFNQNVVHYRPGGFDDRGKYRRTSDYFQELLSIIKNVDSTKYPRRIPYIF